MNARKILIVDDNSESRELMGVALRGAGYGVIPAANGMEAAKAIESATFDLVLSDILMPERDGMELLRDLRKTHPDLPIIAMSGGGRVPAALLLKMAQHLGANAILRKPVRQQELLAAVSSALSSNPGSPKSR